MWQFEASVKVRFESIFAWPLEHTRQGPYLVHTLLFRPYHEQYCYCLRSWCLRALLN